MYNFQCSYSLVIYLVSLTNTTKKGLEGKRQLTQDVSKLIFVLCACITFIFLVLNNKNIRLNKSIFIITIHYQ